MCRLKALERAATGSPLVEFECHLDIQEDSSNNVCIKWRMKVQTEQNKPHRKQTSIA